MYPATLKKLGGGGGVSIKNMVIYIFHSFNLASAVLNISVSFSTPIYLLFVFLRARGVVPLPIQKSSTKSPSLE